MRLRELKIQRAVCGGHHGDLHASLLLYHSWALIDSSFVFFLQGTLKSASTTYQATLIHTTDITYQSPMTFLVAVGNHSHIPAVACHGSEAELA